MGTLADIPSIDAVGLPRNETSFLSLLEVLWGSPVAAESEEDLFMKRPEELTENAWHLVRSGQAGDSEASPWKLKGEARKINLDLPMIFWEITRQYHETNDQRTDWMMLEYKITTIPLTNESFSICRIWKDPGASPVQVSANEIPVQNSPDFDLFSDGDYLELLDLEAPIDYP